MIRQNLLYKMFFPEYSGQTRLIFLQPYLNHECLVNLQYGGTVRGILRFGHFITIAQIPKFQGTRLGVLGTWGWQCPLSPDKPIPAHPSNAAGGTVFENL